MKKIQSFWYISFINQRKLSFVKLWSKDASKNPFVALDYPKNDPLPLKNMMKVKNMFVYVVIIELFIADFLLGM